MSLLQFSLGFVCHPYRSVFGRESLVWLDSYLCISWKLKICVIVRNLSFEMLHSLFSWVHLDPAGVGWGSCNAVWILWARVPCPTPRLDHCSRHCIHCIFGPRTAKRCSHCKALCVTVSRDLINQKKVIVVQNRCQKNGKSTVSKTPKFKATDVQLRGLI